MLVCFNALRRVDMSMRDSTFVPPKERFMSEDGIQASPWQPMIKANFVWSFLARVSICERPSIDVYL